MWRAGRQENLRPPREICFLDNFYRTNQELFFLRQIFDLSLLRKTAAVMNQVMQSDTPNGFPSAWTTTGYVVCAVSALFVGRIVYEETILTWTNGLSFHPVELWLAEAARSLMVLEDGDG